MSQAEENQKKSCELRMATDNLVIVQEMMREEMNLLSGSRYPTNHTVVMRKHWTSLCSEVFEMLKISLCSSHHVEMLKHGLKVIHKHVFCLPKNN